MSISLDDLDTYAGLEYPPGSRFEHLVSGELWIGAIADTGKYGSHQWAKLVTSPSIFDSGVETSRPLETFTIDTIQPWRSTSTLLENEPNKRGIDDDGDGRIDCDRLDGVDNDGDGLIDEDYGAVSENDLYCAYTDTSRLIKNPTHKPIGIKVLQSSYAWIKAVKEPIIIMEYEVINLGRYPLKDVYIGFYFISSIDAWPSSDIDTYIGYWPELMTAYTYAPSEREASPFGITTLELPKPLDSLNYYFKWLSLLEGMDYVYYAKDPTRYDILSGISPPGLPKIRDDMPMKGRQRSPAFVFSFGPINDWHAGDTLRMSFAVVGGRSLRYFADNVYDNAKAAQTLYARKFYPPYVPPSPKLSIETGYKSTTLNWGYKGIGINPEEGWDDANALVDIFPPDHWRRSNPPAGHTKGGRVFEGYRLYRSEDPAGSRNSFVMLKQWDKIDFVGSKYGYDTGIETTYVDENLTTGKRYWYSVTSYGIPDQQVMRYIDRDGMIKTDTLSTNSLESSVLASRKRVKMPFSVSHERNKVLVVPNPYKVDEDYSYEMGGYEGRAKIWNENRRMIKFIHLPEKCKIRIYTMMGEIITTLEQENSMNGELDWNMMSESNRTIASGVYIFTVESEYGTQIGKFVVIR
ncbi:MAG: T9SS type A sorting domain-containing protein [Ignavibacteriales bacterium]|nr:T9SS type A sorting domain-containing protein [Ignavibacteriales bacterium]